jgi:hypothetical protein
LLGWFCFDGGKQIVGKEKARLLAWMVLFFFVEGLMLSSGTETLSYPTPALYILASLCAAAATAAAALFFSS